jgi:TonB family protein
MNRPPNPRLQRTRVRAPLSRKPLGARSTIAAVAVLGIAWLLQAAEKHSLEKAMKHYEAAHPGVLVVGGEVKQPKVVRKVEPNWESIPREKRTQRGPIMVEAVITTEGTVLDPVVISESQPNLDPLFLAALRQWKYEPARKDGKPVPVFLVVTVMF